jgi:hypothetical protein
VFTFTKCLHENASDSDTFSKCLHENACESDDRSTHLGYLKSDLRSQGKCNCHCCHGHSHATFSKCIAVTGIFMQRFLQMLTLHKTVFTFTKCLYENACDSDTFAKCLHENGRDSDGSCTQPGFSSNFK